MCLLGRVDLSGLGTSPHNPRRRLRAILADAAHGRPGARTAASEGSPCSSMSSARYLSASDARRPELEAPRATKLGCRRLTGRFLLGSEAAHSSMMASTLVWRRSASARNSAMASSERFSVTATSARLRRRVRGLRRLCGRCQRAASLPLGVVVWRSCPRGCPAPQAHVALQGMASTTDSVQSRMRISHICDYRFCTVANAGFAQPQASAPMARELRALRRSACR